MPAWAKGSTSGPLQDFSGLYITMSANLQLITHWWKLFTTGFAPCFGGSSTGAYRNLAVLALLDLLGRDMGNELSQQV